jgi:hypothetical protein
MGDNYLDEPRGFRTSLFGLRSIEISRFARDDKGGGREDKGGSREDNALAASASQIQPAQQTGKVRQHTSQLIWRWAL